MQLLGNSFVILSSSRGPLAHLHSLDIMWISFYSIGLLFGALLLISAVRKWIKNVLVSFVLKFVAYGMFFIGAFLMVLVIVTWPN